MTTQRATRPSRAAAARDDSHSSIRDNLTRDGIAGPVDVLSAEQCAVLMKHLRGENVPAPLDWHKGRAATDRVIYEVAAAPQLLSLLRPTLGENIVLWGASTMIRKPGTAHGWHCDMESASPDGCFVTIWLGLRNTSVDSGLWFVAGSHRFGKPIQQVAAERGGDLSDARVLDLARAFEPSARIVRHKMADGQALLFDGRIWHDGRNLSGQESRIALLLQYAASDTVLRMPSGTDYRWPFKFGPSRRMPVVLVSGSDRAGVNRLVPPPPPLQAKESPMITTRAQTVDLPLAEDQATGWRAYPQFEGPTRTLENMSCHISVLSPGHVPHPPHVHPDEELLIALDGEVEIALAKDPHDLTPSRQRLRPGMLSYYPSTQHHTILNPGASPVTYLMFKWRAGEADSAEPLQGSVFHFGQQPAPADAPPFFTELVFEQATHRLGKLHAHFTTLQPGAGYAAHIDAYDVAILVLSGEVETVGASIRPLGLVYYAAGEMHGMRNCGTAPATYLVFEFHSPAAVALDAEARAREQARRAAEKAARKAAKRGLRGLIKRIGKALKARRQDSSR